MTGFETYSPIKWLVEGALSVHVTQPVKRALASFGRSGRWAGRGFVAAVAITASVATHASVETLPSGSVRTVRSQVQMLLDLGEQVEDAVTYAPSLASVGYAEQLIAALRKAPRLPAQSLEFDPDFTF